MSTIPAVELRAISKRYGATFVLSDVSLAVDSGSVHALVGENGAGKSTLLKILSGAIAPTSGEVVVCGTPMQLSRPDVAEANRRGVSVVHQEFSLLPELTIAENVFLGRELTRRGSLDRRRMEEETAALLGRLGSDLPPSAPVASLGVAGAQVVEIAKALSVDASVVALDEPSAVLTGPELDRLFEVVRSLRDSGVAVLYVSHRLDEVFELCDRYTVLKDGRISAEGAIDAIDSDGLVTAMVGRQVANAFPRANHRPGDVRLEVRDLRVVGLPAALSLNVRRGEIVGLCGLGGSGRSRLARAIFGAVASTGTVLVDGAPVPRNKITAAMRAGIVYVPEDRKSAGLALGKSVRYNASLNVLGRIKGWLRSSRLERRFVSQMVREYAIHTASDGDDLVGSLSGGNQQKLVLGKWLAINPSVIVLDEPTRGVDVGAKEQIYRTVRRLADEGAAVLMISSELVEVLGLSDRIVVMADGRIIGELTHDDASEERVLQMITAATRESISSGVRQ